MAIVGSKHAVDSRNLLKSCRPVESATLHCREGLVVERVGEVRRLADLHARVTRGPEVTGEKESYLVQRSRDEILSPTWPP